MKLVFVFVCLLTERFQNGWDSLLPAGQFKNSWTKLVSQWHWSHKETTPETRNQKKLGFLHKATCAKDLDSTWVTCWSFGSDFALEVPNQDKFSCCFLSQKGKENIVLGNLRLGWLLDEILTLVVLGKIYFLFTYMDSGNWVLMDITRTSAVNPGCQAFISSSSSGCFMQT